MNHGVLFAARFDGHRLIKRVATGSLEAARAASMSAGLGGSSTVNPSHAAWSQWMDSDRMAVSAGLDSGQRQ